jgi:hypothetical protein
VHWSVIEKMYRCWTHGVRRTVHANSEPFLTLTSGRYVKCFAARCRGGSQGRRLFVGSGVMTDGSPRYFGAMWLMAASMVISDAASIFVEPLRLPSADRQLSSITTSVLSGMARPRVVIGGGFRDRSLGRSRFKVGAFSHFLLFRLGLSGPVIVTVYPSPSLAIPSRSTMFSTIDVHSITSSISALWWLWLKFRSASEPLLSFDDRVVWCWTLMLLPVGFTMRPITGRRGTAQAQICKFANDSQ